MNFLALIYIGTGSDHANRLYLGYPKNVLNKHVPRSTHSSHFIQFSFGVLETAFRWHLTQEDLLFSTFFIIIEQRTVRFYFFYVLFLSSLKGFSSKKSDNWIKRLFFGDVHSNFEHFLCQHVWFMAFNRTMGTLNSIDFH